VVTQVVVGKDDPAFQNPSKPIGPFYGEEEAKKLGSERGWVVKDDAGRGWRRVVPSPIPLEIVERDAIKSLLDVGFVVIGVGGGGIPVVREEGGSLSGVEAVIDKDYASGLLAASIQADLFLISTAVDKVALNYGQPGQRWLDKMTLVEAKQYLAEGHFAPGSMGPKIRAIIKFLKQGGREALITSPENIERALAGETGTRIVP
jgi:carbamate kinase